MNELPDYVDCQNERIEVCYWYCHKLCPETCAYSLDIKGRSKDGTLEKEVWEENQ